LERIDEEFDATLYDDPIYLIDSKVSGLDYAIKAVRKPGSGEVLNVKVFETGDGVVESSVGQELNTDNKKLSSTDFVFEIYENEFKELFKDGEEYLVVE
jgi:hypothetical protein